MWNWLVNLTVLVQLTASIEPFHEVALKCESTSEINNEDIAYIACSMENVTSSSNQVTVTSMNLSMDELKKLNMSIYIDIVGNGNYPEYFPKNLGKIINGTGGFTYKNTPLKYISRADFKDFAPDLYLIILEDNKIEEIPFDTFYDLPDLIYLDVRDNKLTSLAPNMFANSPAFHTLIIESNEITELHPDLFKNCPEFYVLYAEFNKIEEFHESLFINNPNMTVISMRHNKIQNIPIDFTKFKHLDVADFTHNGGTCDTMYFSFEPYDEHYDKNEQKKWIKTVPEFQQKIEEVCRA
ncbi:unnamed protein product [Chironomus riparius]|uniref:Uncharacterized protein n=1 Tax=Chironomus riparius TaxID=315576 RepID=A0A9N9S2W5_9DIPT|nr:unnamed protein product [Chironomus riparius]